MTCENKVFAILVGQLTVLAALGPLLGFPMFCIMLINGAASWLGSAVLMAVAVGLAWSASRMV